MEEPSEEKGEKRLPGLAVMLLAAGIVLAVGLVMLDRFSRPRPAPESAPATDPGDQAARPLSAAPAPVLDLEQLGEEGAFKTLMEQRKAEYGVEGGLDLIAKPNESLKVGETTVSMQEILDQIQLKEGDIIERDLEGTPDKVVNQRKSRVAQLNMMEDRLQDVDSQLSGNGGQLTPQMRAQLRQEREQLEPIVQVYREYQVTRKALRQLGELVKQAHPEERQAVRQEILDLLAKQKRLEEMLEIPSRDSESRAAERFGIYVVQPGDNIWNIHFRFLHSYFNARGIELSPASDEPNQEGFSSGVGKLLKFSENMVYIYNIKERKLDVDLDLIYPQNKLVVYNMQRVFALLDEIDHRSVNRIQFDGETLWIPAEQ
jgi:hypothetical protein